MNVLYLFASAVDLETESQHSKLLEFWRLDKEIARYQETKNYKELFHSLEYALMCCRAERIIEQLTTKN